MWKEKLYRLLHSPAAGDLWRWSKPCRRWIALICALKCLLSCCSLMIPLATKGLIDGAAARDGARLGWSAAALILTVLGIWGLSLWLSFLSIRANTTLQKSLRSMILEQLLKKRYTNLSVFHSGEMVSRILSDVQVVKNGILELLPGLVSMTVSFFGAAILLIRMDWRFVALLIAGGLLGLFLIVVLEAPMKNRHAAVQEAEAKYHASVQETLENLLLVKASGSEKRMERQVGEKQERLTAAQLKKGYFHAVVNHGINLTFQLSWLLCLLWGVLGIYRGTVTYGMLAAMLQLANQVQGPISGAAGIAGKAYAAVSSAERIRDLLELPEEKDVSVPGIEAGELTELRLKDVRFGYDRDTEPVLQQVSCTIRSGDFVAVTGLSGKGKTTLFHLLLGVYQPDGGCMELCLKLPGQEQPQAVPIGAGTRRMFAYVPQGNTLFSGTLRENIAMFAEDADDEKILEAARTACIAEWIETLPEGLNTVLGERGVGVSEGQAQRIAIARAILTEAPVLLLDESTSALDEQTEQRLLRNLSRLSGETCLIVTHRKAALAFCDYCLLVEHGALTGRSGIKDGSVNGKKQRNLLQ